MPRDGRSIRSRGLDRCDVSQNQATRSPLAVFLSSIRQMCLKGVEYHVRSREGIFLYGGSHPMTLYAPGHMNLEELMMTC